MILLKKVFRKILSMSRLASILMALIPIKFHPVIANQAQAILTKKRKKPKTIKKGKKKKKKVLHKILVETEE